MSYLKFDWPYYHLDSDGLLLDEKDEPVFYDGYMLQFKDSQEAEQFLIDKDIRGNVR